MSEEEMIRQLLDYAETLGFRSWGGHPSVLIYDVDIRGTITHCKLTCSIMVDFHDVHAYFADGRKVTYQEGGPDELRKHLEMNGNPAAIADWAMKEFA